MDEIKSTPKPNGAGRGRVRVGTRARTDHVEDNVELVELVGARGAGLVDAEREARLAGEERRALPVVRHGLRLHAQQLGEDAAQRPHVHRLGVGGLCHALDRAVDQPHYYVKPLVLNAPRPPTCV